MKVLLVAISSKYIHSNLAVYNLKSYADKYVTSRETDEQIEIAEYTINNHLWDIFSDIYKRKPKVIAFSCYIWNIEIVKELMQELKKVLPDTEIWAGGPEVSYNPVEFLEENPSACGIIRGEGEETFKNLAELYFFKNMKNNTLEGIRGITFKNAEGKITETQDAILPDMNKIPFVYEDISSFENKIIYYESSRGCPFSCSYCLSSEEKCLRMKDIGIVKEELKKFIDALVKQVKFVDRTFNCKKSHAKEIWEYIKENDNGITNFHFEISADLLTEDELSVLEQMRPGLVQLEIGVQSTNNETIREIGRKTDFKKLSENVVRINKAGNIHQHLDLIAGLPYEDIKSFEKSFNEVYALKPNQLQVGFLKVLKGTGMFRRQNEYNLKYKDKPPFHILSNKWLSFDDVINIKCLEEAEETFYNSGQFQNSIKYLERHFDNYFEMYTKLGKMFLKYSEKGVLHSRISKYNILLEFMLENGLDEEISKEMATLDVYLRENIKSRPVFSKKLDAEKDRIRKFYREEAQKYLSGYEKYDSRQIEKMTHLEVFGRNPILFAETGNDNGEKTYILFDYINKNIISNSAGIIKIPG